METPPRHLSVSPLPAVILVPWSACGVGGAAVATGMLFAAIAVLPTFVAPGGFSHLTAGRMLAGLGVALLSSAIPYPHRGAPFTRFPRAPSASA